MPTFHYLTTHGIQFSIIDRSSYFTLQEGVEKKNNTLKSCARTTFKGPGKYQQLIDHCTLKFILHSTNIEKEEKKNIRPKNAKDTYSICKNYLDKLNDVQWNYYEKII